MKFPGTLPLGSEYRLLKALKIDIWGFYHTSPSCVLKRNNSLSGQGKNDLVIPPILLLEDVAKDQFPEAISSLIEPYSK
jgi:hypothetical protein